MVINSEIPLVSIQMITYNHEAYIQQAIEGVLRQIVSFKYELIIGEDCSADSTRSICQKYAINYPDKIKLLPSEKNLGIKKNGLRTLEACTGKYIAICEGDDYWIDPHKLQKQVAFLEMNKDFTICTGNALVLDEISNSKREWLGPHWREVSTVREILRFGSSGATCTLLFRREAVSNLPAWFHEVEGGDWAFQIICTSKGKLKYFKEILGVYRRNANSISVKNSIDESIQLYEKFGLKTIRILIENYKNYEKELVLNAAEYWYYNLALLYNQKKDKKNARLAISKTLSKLFVINLSLKKIVILFLLYIKNLELKTTD